MKHSYRSYCQKAFKLSDKIFKNGDKYAKLSHLTTVYLKTMEKMLADCGKFLFLSDSSSFDDKVRMFRYMLSVPCPEFRNFIEIVSKTQFEGIQFDNGVYDFLQTICVCDTKSKSNLLAYLTQSQINAVAKTRFVEAIIYDTDKDFKNWVFSTLVAHAETDADRKFFEHLISRDLFETEIITKYAGDSVVGDLCQVRSSQDKVLQDAQATPTENKPVSSSHSKTTKTK